MIDTNTFTVFGILPYHFFTILGVMVAFSAFLLLAAFRGLDIDRNGISVLISFAGLVAGMQLFGLLVEVLNALQSGESVLGAIKDGFGVVFYGGLTGMILTYLLAQRLLFKRLHSEHLNLLAVCIPLFHCFARIGCFFAGCCYGKVCSSPLSVAYVLHGATEPQQIFPIQLAEAGINLLLFGLLLWMWLKRPRQPLLLWYTALYALCRFVLEFFRGDAVRGLYGGFSFSQYYSVVLLLAAASLAFALKRRRKKYESS